MGSIRTLFGYWSAASWAIFQIHKIVFAKMQWIEIMRVKEENENQFYV